MRSPRISEKLDWLFSFLVTLCVVTVFIREAFAAPIRCHAPAFWYVPDGLLILCVVMFFAVGMFARYQGILALITVSLLIIGIGLLQIQAKSVIFATRYILSFCLGSIAASCSLFDSKRFRFFVGATTFVLAGSIAYDYWFGFSWPESKFMNVLGPVTEIQRTWWREGGERRIPGFAIASTDAALFIACSLTAFVFPRCPKAFFKSLLYVMPVYYSLLLTKQVATTLWVGLLLTLFAVVSFIRLTVQQVGTLFKVMAVLALLACALSPFLLSGLDIGNFLGFSGSSLNERSNDVWIRAIDRSLSFPTLVIGDGLGSIGQAATFTSETMAEVPDNAFLFFMIQFGALALFAFIFALYIVCRSDPRLAGSGSALALIAFLGFNGITANIGNNAVACLFLGYV